MLASTMPTVEDTPTETAVSETMLRWSRWQDLSEWLEPLLLTPGNTASFVADINQCATTLVKLVDEDPDLAIFHIVHVSPEKMAR